MRFMMVLLWVALVALVFWRCGKAASEMFWRKGRSRREGFLLGCLLGPVGLLLAATTPKRDLRHHIKCTRCRNWVRDDLKECPHCGLHLWVTANRLGRASHPSGHDDHPKKRRSA
jgi:hypothetical protein